MIGYATPDPVTRDALTQLADAIERAQAVNADAPRGMARAEVSDWLAGVADDLTVYLGGEMSDEGPVR